MNTVHCLQEKMFFIDGWIMIGIRTISKLTAQGECIILHLPILLTDGLIKLQQIDLAVLWRPLCTSCWIPFVIRNDTLDSYYYYSLRLGYCEFEGFQKMLGE